MAPVIGITSWPRPVDMLGFDQPNDTVPISYVSSVRRAGGLPVLLPVTPEDQLDELLDAVDGIVLSGGGDLDPARYGVEPAPETDRIDPRRDRFDLALTQRVLERRTPALAVCRGIQVLNVLRGGTLHQHLPSHRLLDRPKEPGHPVLVTAGTRLAGAVGAGALEVNSLHHQGLDRLGQGLVPVAVADDGLVEAVELDSDDHLLAVQWHPELLRHLPLHLALFADLVERSGTGG